MSCKEAMDESIGDSLSQEDFIIIKGCCLSLAGDVGDYTSYVFGFQGI